MFTSDGHAVLLLRDNTCFCPLLQASCSMLSSNFRGSCLL